MEKERKSGQGWLETVIIGCLTLILMTVEAPTTRAAPPLAKAATPNRIPAPLHNLDLRPPALRESTAPVAESDFHYFPSAHRMGTITADNAAPAFAASPTANMGRAEAFVKRFHREGLPVARLWENHSALLSLGLNQKGKPGLWLVQKTH